MQLASCVNTLQSAMIARCAAKVHPGTQLPVSLRKACLASGGVMCCSRLGWTQARRGQCCTRQPLPLCYSPSWHLHSPTCHLHQPTCRHYRTTPETWLLLWCHKAKATSKSLLGRSAFMHSFLQHSALLDLACRYADLLSAASGHCARDN